MKRAFLLVVLLMLSVSAFAQTTSIPPMMNFQGHLAKPDGTPVPDTNAQTVTFSLYNALSGGTLLWQQVSTNIAVHNGAFAVKFDFSIGFAAGQTLDSVFASRPYLQIQVGANAPLAPRQPLASSAFAFRAKTAETALGVANGSVMLNSLAPGVLDFSNINGQITGSQIAPGTIAANDLSIDLNNALSLLSTTTGPALVGTVTTGAPAFAVTSGIYSYANSGSNVLIYNTSNPVAPTLVGTITNAGTIGAAAGNYAYCNASDGLRIYNVSNPAAATLVSTTSTGGTVAAASGNYVYLNTYLNSTNNLQIYNVSNPASIKLVSTTPISGRVTSAYGNYVVVSVNNGSSIVLYDVSNPASPIAHAPINGGGGAFAGNYFYVAATDFFGDGVLQIYNDADLTALIGAAPLGDNLYAPATSIAASGNYVSVVCLNKVGYELRVFDVSNPSNPIYKGGDYIGYTDEQGTTISVAVVNGYVYVTDVYNSGLGSGSGSATLVYNVLGENALQVNGGLNVLGNVSAAGFVQASDARYKTHIATLDNALDDVLNLRGVSYDWDRAKWPEKNFTDRKQIGFIAQELEKIFPELVTTDKDGYKSVNYIGVVPVLVESVKTLKTQLDDKQRQIDELKAQAKENADIKKQLAELAAALKKLQDAQNR